MERISYLIEEALPILENWLRATVRDEMQSVLSDDHKKKQPEKLFSRDEVCGILGISLPTLWARTKSGEIKATKIGRRVLYSESEINKFCNR